MIRFEPALLPVQPNVGVANISYGFTNKVNPSNLGDDGLMVPVVIDTPFNVIGVRISLDLTLALALIVLTSYF